MQVIPAINFIEAAQDCGVSNNSTGSEQQVAFQEVSISLKKSGWVQLSVKGALVGVAGTLTATESLTGYFRWKRDGVQIGEVMYFELTSENSAGSTGLKSLVPPGCLTVTDNPGFGTFVYTLHSTPVTANTSMRAEQLTISAYEMGT